MHLRELPNGRVVATLVPFTELERDGETASVARDRVVATARERLDELDAASRADLAEDVEAELETLSLTVSPERSAEKVPLRLSVVVLARQRSAGIVYSVLAPGVPRWSVVAAGRADALTLASRALEDVFEGWSPAPLLPLDVTGNVDLEPLLIPFEPASEASGGGGDPAAELGADDLTALAAAGRLGRLDWREPLVERVLAMLAADGRASVLLVGRGDVGKSALTHEVAARLAAGEVPPALRGRKLIRVSANELIAGSRYTGMWQETAKRLIAIARRTRAIVAMGDPGGIVDAGRWSESDNNLSRVLRPYMERGELRLICEATEEMTAAINKLEPSFIATFHRVDVPEPDADTTREILRAAVRRIEGNLDLGFDDDAIQAALELTRRFEPYRALPGKAVRLLQETAQLTAEGATRIGREEVTRGFARRTGLPVAMLSDAVPLRTAEVRAFFEERVLGQPEAVEAMVDLIAVVKAALGDPDKPVATLFFVGPTGVGKTELCKALAEYLFGSRDRVLRFDMGEYASGDAAARLTGTAWDRHSEGELTRRVREQPFCVVLLDEIEKAHSTVFDVLLSALGEGRVTDASGRTADLRNAIVIMTSNLGAATSSSGGVGFAKATDDHAQRHRSHFITEAERFFRPEFFNRIDRVLAFAPLDQGTITRIARRELGRLLLREGITRRQLLVEIDDRVVDRLAAAGFHPRYGARPLHREIERAVIHPLARLIVEQLPRPGDLIRIHESVEGIDLSVHRIQESASPARRASPARDDATVRGATSARLVTRAREVVAEVAALGEDVATVAVAAELSELLVRINRPDFWDEQDQARATMNRVYQLQRIDDNMNHLRNRAEGLLELAQTLHARRERGRLQEVRVAMGELEDGLEVLRLRIAGAAAGEREPHVVLTFTPVGSASLGWAQALLEMYAAWARRTGHEVTQPAGEGLCLGIAGPGSYALLRGEAGLHRRDRSGPEGRRELARVEVTATPTAASLGPPDTDARATTETGLENDLNQPGRVVRVYSEGARTGVRDPRTGVRVGNLMAVLTEGRIDRFILAMTAQKAADSD